MGTGKDHDRRNMAVAIEEARLSLSQGGIPIGAALFRRTQLLGRGHSERSSVKSTVPLP
jgi:cytosine deaminase